MSAETDLYSALSADAGVAALVAARIYPDLVPAEAALPCIAYERTATEPLHTLHAQVGEFAVLEVSCMAANRLAAEQLGDAVRTAATAAAYQLTDRAAATDPEQGIYAAVLTLRKFTSF